MTEDPKPCPFCGGAAVYETQAEWEDEARISCGNVESCSFEGWAWQSQWNTRPIEDALRAENERLRAELSEWQEAATRAYGEKCPPDEQHCTCVPVLRGEVQQLRAEVERLRGENELYLRRVVKLSNELYEAHNAIALATLLHAIADNPPTRNKAACCE